MRQMLPLADQALTLWPWTSAGQATDAQSAAPSRNHLSIAGFCTGSVSMQLLHRLGGLE
jgi:hypothetical protein